MTLGDMRAKKAYSLLVVCPAYPHTRILDVSMFPDTVSLAWFEQRMTCNECHGPITVEPLRCERRRHKQLSSSERKLRPGSVLAP